MLYSTTLISETRYAIRNLTPQFHYYLGGSSDIRGFARKSLPREVNPALTQLYSGLELRLASVLPYKIEPLIFLDGGVLGFSSNRLEMPFYYAPGSGIRWNSPFGVFRATLALGYIYQNAASANIQFFLSYMEEF